MPLRAGTPDLSTAHSDPLTCPKSKDHRGQWQAPGPQTPSFPESRCLLGEVHNSCTPQAVPIARRRLAALSDTPFCSSSLHTSFRMLCQHELLEGRPCGSSPSGPAPMQAWHGVEAPELFAGKAPEQKTHPTGSHVMDPRSDRVRGFLYVGMATHDVESSQKPVPNPLGLYHYFQRTLRDFTLVYADYLCKAHSAPIERETTHPQPLEGPNPTASGSQPDRPARAAA